MGQWHLSESCGGRSPRSPLRDCRRILAYAANRSDLADLSWTLATAPVVAGLAVSIARDLSAGRFGVDAIALVSMSAALALGQPLAGAVVALMYSGGNVLEDIAVARAEHDLRSLVDRAPREAHRRVGDRIEEVPISAVAIDDQLLVRAGEVVPVDGVVTSRAATIDESALTGEPMPVIKARGAAILSGPLEALAHAHTVLFDKTGTLTVGGARLLSVEVAPGESADEVLMLGASLEQASHHVLASAIVQAAAERGLSLKVPEQVRESMGSGLHGVIEGRHVSAGSRDMIFAGERVSQWASRAIRRASWRSALIVFVAVEGRPIGALLLADELRSDTPRAIRLLREAGVARMVMVTGDHAAAAQAIGARSIWMRCWPTACPPTRSMPCVPSSGCIRPSWSVTASTTPRRWHRRMSGSRLGPQRQRFVRGGRCGDPRRSARSGRRGDCDRAAGTADRRRKHRRRYGTFNPSNAGGDLRLADAGAGGYRSGSD
jgi:cation transport ATPase